MLLTGFFYILVSILWNSITEFYAEQSNEQILTGLSKDISEGNYFGFISTLGRIRMNGSLKEFGIIEGNSQSSKNWLHVSTELFKQQDINYYSCTNSIRMISQYGSKLLISSPIPSTDNTKPSSCLVLEFQLPPKLTTLKKVFYFLFGAVVFIILAGQLFFLAALKRKEFAIEKAELENKMKILSHISNLAKQVSHDIRSPLAALNMMLGELAQVPESKRIIIRSSVQRINDIANELLTKGKQQSSSGISDKSVVVSSANLNKQSAQVLSVELLYPIIDTIVSEKRLQFREKQGVEIEADILNAYGFFAKINSTELKRALSNSITNAVEAFPESRGKVLLSLKSNGSAVVLTISDNGKGIPPHILDKLGQIGVTHGKDGTQSGSGLGVYHAKNAVESFGGKFQIESHENIGTKIIMTFPKVPAPKWFIEKLLIESDTQIITLDDEISIQQVWQSRFKKIDMAKNGITHFTFTSGDEFKIWMLSMDVTKKANRQIYLVDFELLNQKQNGLEIIKELGVGRQSILVTSRYEEQAIREKCEVLGVRLIPKPMAGFVPIEIKKPLEYFDAILIQTS